jgi:hypothetical protein
VYGLLAQARVSGAAFGRPVVVFDLLARAYVLGQLRAVGMGQTSRTGVDCADLGMPGAGLHDVVAVEDHHSTRAFLAVTLEGAISMDQ